MSEPMSVGLDLVGRTIVVTGASSGIGAATALHLAARGANLVIHGRSRSDRLLAVENQIKEVGASHSLDLRVGFLLGDFSDASTWSESDWGDFVSPAWDWGPVHGWVNNAGGDVLTGKWKECSTAEKLNYLWQVDVTATLMLSKTVASRMSDPVMEEPGSIVNIGWDQAEHGMAGESGELFATTKGAIMAMSKSLAQSFAPNVRINCVAPGWIQTQWGTETSEYWDLRAKTESLMGRWGQPEDVAQVIGFLCSPQSAFVTGQVLPVNGGFRFNQIAK